MKIAICDDEQIILTALESNLMQILDQHPIAYQIESFKDGYDLIRNYRDFDLLFLDIDMPILDGLSTAKLIREKNKQCKIVFLTSFGELVYKTFEVNAFRCLIKPVDLLTLAEVLSAVVDDMKAGHRKFISVETQRKKYIQLPVEDIIYIETKHRGVRIHTMDQVIESSMLMKEIEHLLPKSLFFKTHISFLVNLSQIYESQTSEIIMNNQDRVMLSRLKAAKFKSTFVEFIKSSL